MCRLELVAIVLNVVRHSLWLVESNDYFVVRSVHISPTIVNLVFQVDDIKSDAECYLSTSTYVGTLQLHSPELAWNESANYVIVRLQ